MALKFLLSFVVLFVVFWGMWSITEKASLQNKNIASARKLYAHIFSISFFGIVGSVIWLIWSGL